MGERPRSRHPCQEEVHAQDYAIPRDRQLPRAHAAPELNIDVKGERAVSRQRWNGQILELAHGALTRGASTSGIALRPTLRVPALLSGRLAPSRASIVRARPTCRTGPHSLTCAKPTAPGRTAQVCLSGGVGGHDPEEAVDAIPCGRSTASGCEDPGITIRRYGKTCRRRPADSSTAPVVTAMATGKTVARTAPTSRDRRSRANTPPARPQPRPLRTDERLPPLMVPPQSRTQREATTDLRARCPPAPRMLCYLPSADNHRNFTNLAVEIRSRGALLRPDAPRRRC